MRLKKNTAASGFTLVELLISGAILVVVIGSVALVSMASDRAYRTGTTITQLQEQVSVATGRIVSELRIAGSETISPDPLAGPGSNSIQYNQAVGINAGQVAWTPPRMLAFFYEAGEFDDGVDNNSNGLIDEGRVVLTEDLGGPNQRQLVLTRWVPELLEGELQNNLDDNGNGLIDEQGFCLERMDQTLIIHLSLQRRDANGRLLTRTSRTSTRMRN